MIISIHTTSTHHARNKILNGGAPRLLSPTLGHHPWWTRPQRQAEEGEATVMSIHTLPRNLNVAVAVDRDRLGES